MECDPSIRALIVKIDSERHDIVIEVRTTTHCGDGTDNKELDETHLLIDRVTVEFVKHELNRLLAENTYNPLDEEEEH